MQAGLANCERGIHMFDLLYNHAAREVREMLGPPETGKGSAQAHRQAAELVAAMRYCRQAIAPALNDSLLDALSARPVYSLPDVYEKLYALPRDVSRDSALWILRRVMDERDGITVALARFVLKGQGSATESVSASTAS